MLYDSYSLQGPIFVHVYSRGSEGEKYDRRVQSIRTNDISLL